MITPLLMCQVSDPGRGSFLVGVKSVTASGGRPVFSRGLPVYEDASGKRFVIIDAEVSA